MIPLANRPGSGMTTCMKTGWFLGILILMEVGVTTQAQIHDVVIRNGQVADGTGTPRRQADVAIRQGRVVALGQIPERADLEIDASGMVVAPGFVDVHTHADALASQPMAENFVRMGVTTVVAGNCGDSKSDIGRLFRDIESQGAAINLASLVGHNTIRQKAMGGSFDREPTAAELDRMRALAEAAMRDGAVGLSTGLIYLPGVFAKTEEIIELAKVAAAHGGIYATHQRNEGTGIIRSLDEAIRIAREAGIRCQISHIKVAGERAWGRAGEVLAHLDAARASGAEISQDQYAYTASSTSIRQVIPSEAFDGGQKAFLQRLADPAAKAKIVAGMKRRLQDRGRGDYAYAVIASCGHDKSLNGLNLVEAAVKRHGNDSLDAQIETILEIQRRGGAAGVFHGMCEEDIQTFMRHPYTMIGCDSGLRKLGEGVPHPRGYGNNARVLGRYVRELKVLPLEEAIRKMTSLPADTFRLEHRGRIGVGGWADIVVFDPDRVADTATFTDPHHYPVGISHVLVNGVPVLRDGEHTRATPGQALRHRPRP